MTGKRGDRNSANQQALEDIVKIFAETLGFSEEKIRELYRDNEKLKRSAGTGSGPVIHNFNLQGITNTELQRIIDYLQNNPEGIVNLNVQKTAAPKRRASSGKRKSSTPRYTIKQLRDYVQERADEIAGIIRDQPAPDYEEIRGQLGKLFDEVRELSGSYKSLEGAVNRAADKIDEAAGKVESTVSKVEDAADKVEGAVDSAASEIRGAASGAAGSIENAAEGAAKNIAGSAYQVEGAAKGAAGRIEGAADGAARSIRGAADGAASTIEGASKGAASRIEGAASKVENAADNVYGAVDKAASRIESSVDKGFDRVEDRVSDLGEKLNQILEGQNGLREDHRELRKGQTDILSGLGDLKSLYTRLESAVKAVKTYEGGDLAEKVEAMADVLKEIKDKTEELDKDHNDITKLINKRYIDIVGKFTELGVSVEGVKTYIAERCTSKEDIKTIVENELNKLPEPISEENLREILKAEAYGRAEEIKRYFAEQLSKYATRADIANTLIVGLSGLPKPIDESRLRELLEQGSKGLEEKLPGMLEAYATQEQIKRIIEDQLGNLPDPVSKEELENVLDEKLKNIPQGVSKEGLGEALAEKIKEVREYIDGKIEPYATREQIKDILTNGVIQLINNKYAEAVGKFGDLKAEILASLPKPAGKDELGKIIEEKLSGLSAGISAAELGNVLAEKLKDLPYINKKDLEDVLADKLKGYVSEHELSRILAEQLGRLNCASHEDLERIYQANRTVSELLREIFERLGRAEQGYRQGQVPQYTQQNQGSTDSELAIFDRLLEIRKELSEDVNPRLERVYKRLFGDEGQAAGQQDGREGAVEQGDEESGHQGGEGQGTGGQPPGDGSRAQDGAVQGDGQAKAGEGAGNGQAGEQSQQGESREDGAGQAAQQYEQGQEEEKPKKTAEDPIKAYLSLKKQVQNEITGMQIDLMLAYANAARAALKVEGDLRQIDMSKLEEVVERTKYKLQLCEEVLKLAQEKMYIDGAKDDSHAEDIMYGRFGFSQPAIDEVVDGKKSKFEYEDLIGLSKHKMRSKASLPSTKIQETDTGKVLSYVGLKSQRERMQKEVLCRLIDIYEAQERRFSPKQITDLNESYNLGLSKAA